MIADILIPLPLLAIILVVWREVRIYRAQRDARDLGRADERAVSAALGYAMRADHPWSPLQHARPATVSEPDGACHEREFDAAQDTP